MCTGSILSVIDTLCVEFNFELDSTNFIIYFSGLFYSIPFLDYLVHHGLMYSPLDALKVWLVRIWCVVVMNTYV